MTNFERIKNMNLEEFKTFLTAAINDCGTICGANCERCSDCKDGVELFLNQDCGTFFKDLKFGDKFTIGREDKNIFIKTDNFYFTNPREDEFAIMCNAINLRTGLPIELCGDRLVYVKGVDLE